MKIKARDIIKGWPKPRSTSVTSPSLHTNDMWWGRSHWDVSDVDRLVVELKATAYYHKQQALMCVLYRNELRNDR